MMLRPTGAEPMTKIATATRHIGGSLLPSSNPHILAPIHASFGVLQVRALPDLDTHALFLTHDRGECALVMHANGYSCHVLAMQMVEQNMAKAREQVQYILDCGGMAMSFPFILQWLTIPSGEAK